MEFLELTDLYNPEKLTGFLHKNGKYYDTCRSTAIQVYYKDEKETQISKIEFWQKFEDGRLLKMVGFTSKSILSTYTTN